jgi:hypothetical protein
MGANGKDTSDVPADLARLRLLPWKTDTGKPRFLSSDGASGALTRLADEMEAAQLSTGADVLREARKVLNDPMAPHGALRYAGMRLAECLADALRIAESRGMRLPMPNVDVADGPTLPAETFE